MDMMTPAPIITTSLQDGIFTGVLLVVGGLLGMTIIAVLTYLARGRKGGR